ncbi:MAG: 2,3-diphosphoglycerate-dependent phosphoglycerate mutase [Candidatus Levybacteria bacterium]|nr:2,3-diphosphoglycerate-dependent phosphoglycerate mutase [Candidatus Levybacteria bacterium]
MANLILVRHGESLWNAKGVWTGLTDISLSEKGRQEARLAGKSLENIKIDLAFTSVLKRAKETLDEIRKVLNLNTLSSIEDEALNERDYGYLTGKNKWEIQKEVGKSEFQKIRRGWNMPIKNGESLKDVYNRVVPYYQNKILPKLKAGKNVLVVAHGNSLRALVKYLENISDKDVEKLEIATGEIYIYEIDATGEIVSKKTLKTSLGRI